MVVKLAAEDKMRYKIKLSVKSFCCRAWRWTLEFWTSNPERKVPKEILDKLTVKHIRPGKGAAIKNPRSRELRQTKILGGEMWDGVSPFSVFSFPRLVPCCDQPSSTLSSTCLTKEREAQESIGVCKPSGHAL